MLGPAGGVLRGLFRADGFAVVFGEDSVVSGLGEDFAEELDHSPAFLGHGWPGLRVGLVAQAAVEFGEAVGGSELGVGLLLRV